MQMYKVMMLPMAEEDIMNNTDYIAFEKKALETLIFVPILYQSVKNIVEL